MQGGSLPRTFDVRARYTVDGAHASTRISNIFTGHYEMEGNNLGLRSLRNEGLLRAHWDAVEEGAEPRRSRRNASVHASPDLLIFNSGLHDALYMPGRVWSPSLFDEALREAVEKLWRPLLSAASARAATLKRPAPVFVWHQTVVPAGVVNRRLPLNPQKVELQNRLTTGVLAPAGLFDFVDLFDVTFPWHW